MTSPSIDRPMGQLADGLAIAVAVALPWSSSVVSILVVLWLLALLPTLKARDVRREVATAAGALPVALVVLGALGMLWADVPWPERLGGLDSFLKLLMHPASAGAVPPLRPRALGARRLSRLLQRAAGGVLRFPGLAAGHPDRRRPRRPAQECGDAMRRIHSLRLCAAVSHHRKSAPGTDVGRMCHDGARPRLSGQHLSSSQRRKYYLSFRSSPR